MSSPEAKLSQSKTQPETQNLDPPGVTVAEAEALERLARLNESLRARALPEPPSQEQPQLESQPVRRLPYLRPGRIIKSLLALAAAIALLWLPVQRLLYSMSAEAIINARVVNLRAPIDGVVRVVAPSIAVGTLVKPGEPLLQITNARAGRERLDDLRRTVNALRSEIAAQTQRLERLRSIQGDVEQQRDAFQRGRIRQLEARHAELMSDLRAAQASHEDAAKSLERSNRLNEQGYQTTATLLHAERDFKVAETKIEAARKRLESNKIELEAAREGLFVGDSYNDMPRSAQRLDEINQQIADLSGQLSERKSRLPYLEKELAGEAQSYAVHSRASVESRVEGRIWEVTTANGEEVRKGQDLMRVLDCAGAVVTATVSESVYNKLWIGQPVEFTLLGQSVAHAGTVSALTGLAAASSNLAINQSAFTREPYHVTISVPDLAANKECNVGRTGSVMFGRAPAGSTGLAESAERAVDAIRLGHSGGIMLDRASRIANAIAGALRTSAEKAIESVTVRQGHP